MATVTSLIGKKYMLECALNKDVPENLVVRLSTNDITPDEDTIASEFTEATFTGYAGIVTAPADWTVAVDDVGGENHMVATHDEVEFVSTASAQDQTITCAYLVTQTSGILIASNRFTAPQIANHIVNTGDKKTVTPTISLTP